MASTIQVPSASGIYPPSLADEIAALAAAAKHDIEELQRGSGGTPTGSPTKGTAKLQGGHAEVTGVTVPPDASIQVTRNTTIGNEIGQLSVPSADRTSLSFKIVCTSTEETSTVDWVIHG